MKKISEVTAWPPGPWGTSGSGDVTLHPKKAVLGRAVEIRGRISLTATENGNSYSTIIKVDDKKIRTQVVDALNRATGETVAKAGEFTLDDAD